MQITENFKGKLLKLFSALPPWALSLERKKRIRREEESRDTQSKGFEHRPPSPL